MALCEGEVVFPVKTLSYNFLNFSKEEGIILYGIKLSL